MFAMVSSSPLHKVEEVRVFASPPSVRAVTRHLPVLVDEYLVPVVPDRATSHNPERFPVNNINGYRLQS